MNFYEASLIDTKEGIQCKVYSNSHPKGVVIVKPKYIPSSLIEFDGLRKRFLFGKCMTRFNLFKKKEVVKKILFQLKQKYPEYIYNCDKHKNWFLVVPENKIKKFYCTQTGLKELMKVPHNDADDYLKSTKELIEFILKSGIKIEDIGISHSTLLGNYTPGKSDIDILIFGKENGWNLINFLETAEHPKLKWKTKEDWGKYYEKRIVSKNFDKDEYVFNMVRKKDDGFFGGHVFSFFVVEKPDELCYNWEDDHEPLATIKMHGIVKDAYNSIVRPGFYEIKDSKIIDGHKEVPIKRVVTWSRPFVLQVKEGEKLEACGLLEKVKTKNGEEYYQIVIGYMDTYTTERGEQEYIKAVPEVVK
jgi:predicted nucleotidyltransferase